MRQRNCWAVALGLTLTEFVYADGLLAIDNPARLDALTKAYAVVEAFEGNDQVPMREYGASWQGNYTPRNSNNIGLLAARVETGVQWRGYRWGALVRADGLVQANRDTSDVTRQYLTQAGYDTGRSYVLDYSVKGFEAHGARVSKSLAVATNRPWKVQLGVGLSYLRGSRLKLETVTGQLITLNAKDLGAAAQRDSSDTTLATGDMAQFNAPGGRPGSLSGAGYALDVGLVAQHSDSGLELELAVADLLGRIDWTDVPNNVTVYNNAVKYYDANGYAQFNPLTTRVSSYQSIHQRLAPKVRLALSYPVGQARLLGAADFTQGNWFAQLAVSYVLSPQWSLKTELDVRFRTVAVVMQLPWGHVGLRSSALNSAAAKAYGVTAGVQIPW